MADEDTKLDKVLTHLDALHTKIDSIDAEHKKDRADAAEWKARADAAEKERSDKARKDAEEKEKADKMRADAEEKEKADKARADAEAKEKEEKEKADKARVDAEEKERADAAARASGNTDLAKKLAEIERRLPATIADADKGAFAEVQMRADSAYQAWSLGQAPYALNGETLSDYRVRLLSKIKQHSKVYKDSNLGVLVTDSAAFSVVENSIINDAVEASSAQVTIGAPLREQVTRAASGHIVTKFVGDPAVTWAPFMGGATQFGKINTNFANRR